MMGALVVAAAIIVFRVNLGSNSPFYSTLGISSGARMVPGLPLETMLSKIVSDKSQKYHCGISVTIMLSNGTKLSATAGQRSYGAKTSQPVSNYDAPISHMHMFRNNNFLMYTFLSGPSG